MGGATSTWRWARRARSMTWPGAPRARSFWWCTASCRPRPRSSTSSARRCSTSARAHATLSHGPPTAASSCSAGSATSPATSNSGTTTARSLSHTSRPRAPPTGAGLRALASSSPPRSFHASASIMDSRSGNTTGPLCTLKRPLTRCTRSRGGRHVSLSSLTAPPAPTPGRPPPAPPQREAPQPPQHSQRPTFRLICAGRGRGAGLRGRRSRCISTRRRPRSGVRILCSASRCRPGRWTRTTS
mmetsp:Transcript_1183/g.2591  ORF Transcript_1183/g.2591 Transcript_1183/m.2591 type:complete len:243 (-) Transcript_1183:373-1101(-)